MGGADRSGPRGLPSARCLLLRRGDAAWSHACPVGNSFLSPGPHRPSGPACFGLRIQAPSRFLGVPGRRKHGSLPGTMHARTSTPPPSGARCLAGQSPPLAPRHLCSQWAGVVLYRVRGHLVSLSHFVCTSGSLTQLTCSFVLVYFSPLVLIGTV